MIVLVATATSILVDDLPLLEGSDGRRADEVVLTGRTRVRRRNDMLILETDGTMEVIQ